MISSQEFFINTPPYSEIEHKDIATFKAQIINGESSLRAYCARCKDDSVFIRFDGDFEMSGALRRPQRRQDVVDMSRMMIAHQWTYDQGFCITDYICSGGCGHVLIFFTVVTREVAFKVGQWPSYADLGTKLDKKYLKVLSKERFDEFNRAVGLAAHDIGVGSFVYLRRIVEDFVDEAHGHAKSNQGWDENKYQASRYKEKMEAVKNLLPPFLIQNSNVYSIVSKGIHELSEKECLEYFPIVRGVIELTLDEKLTVLEAEEKRKTITTAIGKVAGELKS